MSAAAESIVQDATRAWLEGCSLESSMTWVPATPLPAVLRRDAEPTRQQAAAIRAETDIVNANLEDFPVSSLAPSRVVACRELGKSPNT